MVSSIICCNKSNRSEQKDVNLTVRNIFKQEFELSSIKSKQIIVITDGSIMCSLCYKSLAQEMKKLKEIFQDSLLTICLIRDYNSVVNNKRNATAYSKILNQDSTFFDMPSESNTKIGLIAKQYNFNDYPSILVVNNSKIVSYEYNRIFDAYGVMLQRVAKEIEEILN